MITNILLGLILGVVITSFIILNKKINKIDDYVRRTFSNTNLIDTTVDNNNKIINIVLDKISDFRLMYNENYHNLISSLKSEFNDMYITIDDIYKRFNVIDKDIQSLIVAEHRTTRNEIKKLAKISSKKKSQSKTSKSITHTRKCE